MKYRYTCLFLMLVGDVGKYVADMEKEGICDVAYRLSRWDG